MGTKIVADKVGRGTNDTLSTDGSLTVGDNTSDRLTVNARINSNLTPSDNNQYGLGIETLNWNHAYINTLHLASSGGSNNQMLYNIGDGEIGATTSIWTSGSAIGIGNSNPTHSIDIVSGVANGSRVRLQQNQGSNADGPDIKFERARGTVGSPANLQANDSIGRMEAFSYSSGISGYISSGNFGWQCVDGFGEGNSKFSIQVRVRNESNVSVLRTIMETDPAGPIEFTGDLYPNTDVSFNLGSSTASQRWKELHVESVVTDTIAAPTGGTSFTGSLDFSGATVGSFEVSDFTVLDGVREKSSNIQNATGTVTHDCNNGHVFYHTSINGNFTANFTNINITDQGYATAVTLVLAQGATGYLPTGVQIGGVTQTIRWQGGSQPTPGSNTWDAVSFSIMNNGGTYLVLGQLVSFG